MTLPPTLAQLERVRLARAPRGLFGAAGDAPVRTYGWDSVFTMKLSDVNAAIEARGASPDGFSQTVDGAYAVAADFAPWRVGHTGDGVLVNLHIGLNGVTAGAIGAAKPLPDCVAVVQVRLAFVPHERGPMAGSLTAGPLAALGDAASATFSLRIATEAEAPLRFGGPLGGGAPQPAAALVALGPKEEGASLGTMDRVLVEAALVTWLNDNLGAFAHVFAEVSLVAAPPDGDFGWLKPAYASYAFLGGETEADSQLAILTLTDPARAPGLYEAVSPHALPGEDEDATLVLSKRRILENIVRPALPKAFRGIRERDLAVSAETEALELTRQTQVHGVVHDGKPYDALLRFLKIAIRGDELVTHAFTETEVSPGIVSEVDTESRFRLRLLPKPGGGQTLTYTQIGEPSVYESTRHDKTIDIIKIVVTIIGALVGIVVGLLTMGLSWVAAAVCAVLCAGAFAAIAQIPDIIEAVRKGQTPTIDLLVANAAAPVHWPGGGGFRPSRAVLNQSLVISGAVT